MTYIISLYDLMITEDQGQIYFYKPCNKVAGTCEYGNELSGSVKAGNFLTSCKTS
jgi:hypothetical protein